MSAFIAEGGCSFCAWCLYQCLTFSIELFKTNLLLNYLWYQVSVLETVRLARKTVKQNSLAKTSFPINLVRSSSDWLHGKIFSKYNCQHIFRNQEIYFCDSYPFLIFLIMDKYYKVSHCWARLLSLLFFCDQSKMTWDCKIRYQEYWLTVIYFSVCNEKKKHFKSSYWGMCVRVRERNNRQWLFASYYWRKNTAYEMNKFFQPRDMILCQLERKFYLFQVNSNWKI